MKQYKIHTYKQQPVYLQPRIVTNRNRRNMAQIFTCKLKEPRAGMPRGTTIQVASSFSSPADYEIGDECERRFGKRSRDAQYKGYWEIKKN